MQDDDALEAFVRKAAIGVWHASCSARMAADGDSMAVTDPQGRVRGVEGLRVVDASIFPLVPCANTNFPTLMTAEDCRRHCAAGELSCRQPFGGRQPEPGCALASVGVCLAAIS